MSRPVPGGYRAVLTLPGAGRAFTAASLGRLSYATLSLALLLSVQQATGSYGIAGAAVGVAALGSGLMPVKSRLVDRLGAPRVLPVLAGLCAAALVSIAVAAGSGVRSATVYLLLGAAAGLASPPVGPSMRALWARLTPEPAARRRAYSLDGASEEVLFTAGPLLVAALTAVDGRTGPIAALVLTAVLNVAGGVGLAVAASASPPDRPRLEASVSLLGPLRAPGFGLLVAVVLGVGIGGGPIEVAVLARAQASGDPQAVGVLVAVLSAGSVLGGLWWGRRAHRRSTAIHLICLTVLLAAGSLAAAAAPTLPVLGLALFIAGLASAPTLVVAYLAADDLAPPGGRTEATSWVSTANNVGVALGAGGAGVLVDRAGPGSAFLAGAAVLAITAGLLSVIGRRLQPVNPPEHEPTR